MSSASIDFAIAKRWKEQNLDALFKSYWEDTTVQGTHPLNDGDARPGTQMPYAVYIKETPRLIFRSTGKRNENENEMEYWSVPITFRVHARTPPVNTKNYGRTGKAILTELIGRSEPNGSGILKAFDDATGLLDMGEGNDCHVCTETGPDFHGREDDDIWFWVLQFEIRFERTRRTRLE